MTTKITDTVEAITTEDAQNPYAWAKNNLSEKRAAVFYKALRKLDNQKHSTEYWDAMRKVDAIADDYFRAHYDRATEIENETEAECREIDRQINELYTKQRALREEARNKVAAIRMGAYQLPEYKFATMQMAKIGQKEQEAHLPKVVALMQNYLNRQIEARQAAAEWANR